MMLQSYIPTFTAPQVQGLAPDLQDTLAGLVNQWSKKRPRNTLRQRYVDAKVLVKNLNLSVPDYISTELDTVLGWPEKAVYTLADMCMWDGLVDPEGNEDPFELEELLEENRFDVELPQAIVSELTHSCAFITTTKGDVPAGDPDVIVMPHSADNATGLWDRRRRQLSAGLIIEDTDNLDRPTQMLLVTPFEIIRCIKGAQWYVDFRTVHGLARTPMEVIAYRPTLTRPFGRSRISRPVMSIADRAMRGALRLDVASEIYTVPGLLLNGITQDQWEEISQWSWKMGSVKGLTLNEAEEKADAVSINASSMQPHVEVLRYLATEFSGVTALPLSSLGIVQDNPESAESMFARKEELVIDASNNNRGCGHSIRRVCQNAVMLRDGRDEVTDELRKISSKWRNPAMPSTVSQSDAIIKQVSAIPDLAATDVVLEELGYTSDQIVRIRAQIRRARGTGLLDQLATGPASPTPTENIPQPLTPTN